jgi:hypothetical protein
VNLRGKGKSISGSFGGDGIIIGGVKKAKIWFEFGRFDIEILEIKSIDENLEEIRTLEIDIVPVGNADSNEIKIEDIETDNGKAKTVKIRRC